MSTEEEEIQPLITKIDDMADIESYPESEPESSASSLKIMGGYLSAVMYILLGIILVGFVNYPTDATITIFRTEYQLRDVVLASYVLVMSLLISVAINSSLISKLFKIVFDEQIKKRNLIVLTIMWGMVTHGMSLVYTPLTENFGESLGLVELTTYFPIIALLFCMIAACCPGFCSLCCFLVKKPED